MSTPELKTVTATRSKGNRFSLILTAVALSVLAWIAFRTVRGLLMLGYVDSAIGRVRAVAAAEAQFAKSHPELGYTCALSQLPRDEQITRLANDPNDNGYTFEIAGCLSSDPQKPNSTYHITARPLHSRLPAFCSNSSGVVRSDDTGSVEKCLASGIPLGSS